MPEAEVRTESDQCPEFFDHQTTARKLKDVLSLRLPSFYRPVGKAGKELLAQDLSRFPTRNVHDQSS
jgi:hypothetical protein